MKKFYLTTVIALFLLICSNGIQAQSDQATLNQAELMKKFLGTWQANVGKDTIEIWEGQQYEKALVIKVSQVIKGKKNLLYINNVSFDGNEGKSKGFLLLSNGGYATWIGFFTTEKIFMGNLVQNFNPEMTDLKFQGVFTNSNEYIWTEYNKESVKILEHKFRKI